MKKCKIKSSNFQKLKKKKHLLLDKKSTFKIFENQKFKNIKSKKTKEHILSMMCDNNELIDILNHNFKLNYFHLEQLSTNSQLNDFKFLQKFKIVLDEEIENVKFQLSKQDNSNLKIQNLKAMRNTTKLLNICHFCKKKEISSENIKKIEQELTTKLYKNEDCSASFNLFRKLFIEINETFQNLHLSKTILTTNFFLAQRALLQKILKSLDKNAFNIVNDITLDLLHIEYHKLQTQIRFKSNLLPELPSILFIFINSFSHEYIHNLHEFIILFYSFFSLNKFFDSLFKNIEAKGYIQSTQTMYNTIFRQTMAFVIRFSFIEPILIVLNIKTIFFFTYRLLILEYNEKKIYSLFNQRSEQKQQRNLEKAIECILRCNKFISSKMILDNLEFGIFELLDDYIGDTQEYEYFYRLLIQNEYNSVLKEKGQSNHVTNSNIMLNE